MDRNRWGVKWLLCLALMLLALRCVAAQLVATKDLSGNVAVSALPAKSHPEPSPAPTTSNPEIARKADCVIGIRDGEVVRKTPEKLQLEVIRIDPTVVYHGAEFSVTVRLKNAGADSVLVPWETPPVTPDTDPKTGNTSTEIASIHLSLATGEASRTSSNLKGEAVLSAAPSNRLQQTELLSGQWVEVKFKAAIKCDSSMSPACHVSAASRHAELTAHWWEWLSTHEVDGCNVWSGWYNLREVDSEPLPVVYVAASSVDDRKSASPH